METNSGDPSPPTSSNHRRRSGAAKRKAATAALSALSTLSATLNPPTKRQSKERNPNPISHHLLFQSSHHSGPLTRARQSPNKLPGSGGNESALDIENMAERNDIAGVGLDPMVTGEETEDLFSVGKEEEESVVDLEFEAVKSRAKDAHVVPTFSGWFSWNSIHDIEKQTLVSFFDGKSEKRTPELYLLIRNSIMKKFHSNPESKIELKDLSELSNGDSDSWQEVLEFLDHWGLINFHPFPPTGEDARKTGEDPTGDKKDPSLLDKLYQFETNQSYVPPVAKKVQAVQHAVPALVQGVLPEPGLGEDLLAPTEPSIEYHCNSCSADCSRKRYHCRTQADFDLCTDCYTEGKFGEGMTSADFILMESAEAPGVGGATWTDEETLLLLEALELFGANWNEIADHVGTKSKAQCMLHFLQMPIQDSFLNEKSEEEEKDKKKDEPLDDDLTAEKDVNDAGIDVLKEAFEAVGYFPETDWGSFADAGNPVMALAAFLTGLVEHDKGSMTTYHRSSLKAMSEASPSLQLATRHCFILEGPPHDDVSSPVSSASAASKVKSPGTENTEKTEDLNEKSDTKADDSKKENDEESKTENKSSDNTKEKSENNEKEEEITENKKSGDLLQTIKSEDDSKQTNGPSSVLEESGPSEKKDEKTNNGNGKDGECNIIRLKRAASTALSSAAVKAKFLAKQEEDQIRQLVTVIVDKQFRKMEAKLAMFFDLEGMIMRVKEQTDKVRQRLLHERSQIIAARLGLQNPPPFRNPNPNPNPYPNPNPNQAANRLAAAYASAMAGQRPPNMVSSMPIRRP